MSAPHIFYYVQYLEGIGHAVRAGRIANALAQHGATVTLVLGGEPVPQLAAPRCDIVQLPPLRATPQSYSRLLQPDGSAADATYQARRRDVLLDAFDVATPDVLMTEGYPFGRWAMEFELGPLLETAKARPSGRPLIIASLRDILQVPKDAQKVTRAVAIYDKHFDAMLIHGDPRLIPIEASFPAIRPFLDTAHYTGLVVPTPSDPVKPGHGEGVDVVVTAGGGAIAERVLAAAIAAKPLSPLADSKWLALAGPRMPEADFSRLTREAAANDVALERFRPDLVSLLAQARLSIQRAGYNTIADLLVSGCRAVLVPDGDHQQREQPLRAERLAALGRAVNLDESNLTPKTMAAAIAEAMDQDISPINLDLDGAATSARIVLELSARRQGSEFAPEHRCC